MLTDYFHINAVRIQHIGCVVISVVVHSDTWRPVIDSAGIQRCLKESVDEVSILSGKSDVGTSTWSFIVMDPDAGIAVLAKAMPRTPT